MRLGAYDARRLCMHGAYIETGLERVEAVARAPNPSSNPVVTVDVGSIVVTRASTNEY